MQDLSTTCVNRNDITHTTQPFVKHASLEKMSLINCGTDCQLITK